VTPAPTWYAAPGAAATAGGCVGTESGKLNEMLTCRELPATFFIKVPLQYGFERGATQLIRPAYHMRVADVAARIQLHLHHHGSLHALLSAAAG